MEIKLDVLVSTCIKHRKPWPRISWLGQEKEAIFLIDDKCISEINLVSGKTKKKIPRLQSLLKNVVVIATSRNGAWLAGILSTGELFLWNKDQDYLKTVPAIEESRKVITAAQVQPPSPSQLPASILVSLDLSPSMQACLSLIARTNCSFIWKQCSMRLYLYVSGDGNKVLLSTPTACVFLWESTECKDISSAEHSSLAGHWSQIIPEESVILPSTEDKETGMNADFIKNEILGDCCLCSFMFYSGECLMLTFLALRWHENSFRYVSSLSYHILWAQQACCLSTLVPVCMSVKSRGALLTTFSRDGLLLAVAINQNDPKATQILFINTLNFVTVSGNLKGCSSKNHVVSSKFVRSYWVGDMSWTPDSLFLACMLKRGSLILLTCMGELLTLITSGCSIEFGPAEFIPFHPLITYRLQQSLSQDSNNHSLGSSASESDLMRQRFSVTSHSRLPYLIVSDGYMLTVLRFSDNLSPSGVMRSLLLDSAQRLEKIHQDLRTHKSKGKRLQLRSLSSLKASLLKQYQNHNSAFPTIPKFLQKEETAEHSEKTADLQDYDDESDDDKQFQNISSAFCSQRPDSFFSRADQGQLEFASMFDTVHAKDDTNAKDDLSMELNSIKKNLLAAWGIGISKNLQEKDMLLNYTVGCITHFFNILQFIESPLLSHVAFLNKSVKTNLWMHCILKHFYQCLTVFYWDVTDRRTVGHLVKLTLQTLKLLLIQKQDQFSNYLLGCFCLLKMVAHSLNGKSIPHYEVMSAVSDVNNSLELDSLIVPIFQVLDGSSAQKFHSLNSLLKIPPQAIKLGVKPENRLMILWRLLYKQVLFYQSQLNRKISQIGKLFTEMKIAHEESVVAKLIGHIQAVLQSSGETLEQTWKLNSVIGEEQFLLGSYEESLDLWKRALQETKAKGEKRTQFLQTRYYLAMLYCHLYHYNLREAQGLSDHLVKEVLKRSQLPVRKADDFTDGECFQYELWMIKDVHPDAAAAVIKSMARFMAAYFTNQLLYVLPPHKVDILPPLHINQGQFPRVVPLQHSVVTSAVRDQNLSSVWTAEYALDLLFVGGLIPEAVWLARKLGDWKMSVTIGVAYNLYCQSSSGIARSEKMELHLPLNLTPTHIFQEKLQSFLGQPVNFETSNEGSNKYKHFTDPIEEEDGNVLFGSVQEILKAAVMADADILSETFQLLMDSAKDLSRKLSGLVPDGLYLPAPPLYCPQPASLSEEDYNDSPLKIERDYRQKVSGVLQRILLLFRAARCSFPVAQWYIVKLKWARKVMQKIRMKGNLPSLSSFPDTLLRYSKLSTIFFRPASSGDHHFDDVSCKAIGCFRELCALCWMLHVRERLSDCCRKYQTARETVGNQKDYKKAEYDAHIVEHSLNAMEWACRMLPFARFMNVEELVQDIILSLVGELPPIRKVAEILVKAFPNTEDVRVPLRDKYHALQQRLRHCIVRGPKSEEMMSVVIQATHKMRMKALKRVIRNIGPIEISIWVPSEEETPDDEAYCYDRFSLGTSLSRSTLSDCGNPQVYSDAETTDTLSEALLAEGTRDQAPSPQRETWPHMEEQTGRKNTAYKIRYLNCKAKQKEKEHTILPNHRTLPVVGAWEFERDDDEYVKFLDLFLSYMLERDLVNCSDPGIPFLISFSELLREHELHSLLFDVHTTLKRRQGKTNSQNVFRAGCCYAVTRASCDSKPVSLCNEKQKCLENQMSVSVLKPADSSMCDSMNGVKKYMGKRGLFGLNHLSVYRAQDNKQEITVTPITQTLSDHACSSLQTSVTYKYMYKTIHVNDVIPREELGLELKNEFSNIARLLEWMIRWSDRRLLCDTNTLESFQESRPMLHVKTSAAAILTSLWLLGLPFCDELRAKHTNFKNPDYHYLMSSASLPETRSKIQKKSSVNSSCSPSTETPHAVQDVNAHDEPCENVLGICTETKHSKKNEMNENYSVTHSIEGGVIGFDEVGAFQEVDKTSENEELFEEPFGAPKSPSISVSIKLVQQKEEHISTLDVESPWEEPMMEKLEGKIAKQNGTVPHSFGLEMNADAPSNIEICVCGDQPSLMGISSVPYDGPGCSKKQEVQEGELIAEPSNVSEAVRQMLQNEMFKLVQLQQINFLSLMQIVGSSFASLPNVQHILQQPQSIQLGGNQALHTVRSNCADTFVPIQSTDISSETQLPSKENVGKSKKSSSHPQERNILNDQTSKESTHNHPDVNISLSLSESQSNGMGFIQAPENLLPSAPAKLLHLLSPSVENQKTSKLIPIAKSLRYENGFPLLKLESDHFKSLNLYPLKVSQAFIRPLPQPRVAWDLSPSLQNPPLSCTLGAKTNSTTHLNKYHEISQVREEKKRWSEAKSKGPPKLLNHNQYEEEQNLPPRHYLHTNVSAEKPLSAQHASFYGTYQHSAGIPLLHLQLNPAPRFPPITRPPIPASLIPIRSVTEETNSRDKLQHTGLSILHADLPPRNKFQSPKLIPLQNLIAFEKSRQCTSVPQDFIGQAHPVQIELLKASTEPFDTRHAQNNTKREKRRSEKQIKERADKKKASVTFCPDDSIISTDDVETEIQDQQAESSSYHGDSVLISPDTIGEAITTSAGLHYMASTMKKPAETQDASTNTDTALKSNQDIETDSEDVLSEHLRNQPITSVPTTEHLTSSVPQTLPPDMYLNFRFHTAVGETLLPSSVSDTAPDVIEHNYINVIDIEESDLLRDLPVIAESTEEIITTQQHENFTIPSSAKLHHMAASVTNAVPPNEFQRQDDHQNILISVQEEDIKVDSGRDNLTWNLLHDDVSIIHSEGLSAKIISKEHFCTKLQEMDIQLQALQNIAENMEKDFSNTKLIVKTIEDLGMIESPDVGAASLFSDGVGDIDEAHYVSSVDFEDRMDEEEEGSRPEYSADSYTALHAHSISLATSAANLPSHLKSSSDIHIHEDLGDSFTDDPLQITGLSCITDTVNDLVTEGGVSPTEMSITKTQDKKIFRIYDTAAGYSQKTKREKKEIQVWMKRKRKERLEEYRKKLDEQRQREYNPFNLKNNMQFGLTAKEIKLSQKKKDEKDKALLSEHHSLRVSQALSLMNEMLSEIVQLPASESRPLSKTTIFPRDFRKQHLLSARGSCPGSRSLSASQAERSRTFAKPGFGQARSHSTPPYGLPQSRGTATGVLQKNISEGGIRHATHYPGNSRPVAIRPQDQTSQLTRRGMLTDFNRRRVWLQGSASQRMGIGKGRPNSARQASDYLTVSTKNLRRPAPHTIAIQTEGRGLNYESERDSVSPWSVPDDIQRILHDNYDSLLEVAVPHEEDLSPLSVNEVDSISESTGSILSKLDWNAVEAMVANVEEN